MSVDDESIVRRKIGLKWLSKVYNSNICSQEQINLMLYGCRYVLWGSMENLLVYDLRVMSQSYLCKVDKIPWRGNQSVARPIPTHGTAQTQDKYT
jgi:hypothetical protein